MRVLLLAGDYYWQRALANQLSIIPGITLAGVIVHRRPSTMRLAWVRKAIIRRPGQLASKVLQRLFYNHIIEGIDHEALKRYGRDGEPQPWPAGRTTHVEDISGQESVSQMRRLEPDLIAVYGTGLIKAPVFDLDPMKGLINLHTGISPYYKGGPNCTLWCLANHEPQFIGSTIHRLDIGIDSGPILRTAQSPVEADDTVAGLACKAVAVGHELYVQVIEALARGLPITPVPQDQIGSGRTYLGRDWNVLHLARAVRYVQSGALARWVESGKPGTEQVRLVNAIRATEGISSDVVLI
jgi:folate-dependent phosphoribosylglycinamide formyltransferase PurN